MDIFNARKFSYICDVYAKLKSRDHYVYDLHLLYRIQFDILEPSEGATIWILITFSIWQDIISDYMQGA